MFDKMWLISQANSVILEVKVDANSIGQDLLEKVRQQHYYNITLYSITTIFIGMSYFYSISL